MELRVECETISAEPVHNDSRIRIVSSIRESSPNMFESSQNVESPVHIDEQQFADDFEDMNDDPNDNSIEKRINDAEFLFQFDVPITQEVLNEMEEETSYSTGSIEKTNSGSGSLSFSCYICSFKTNCSVGFENHMRSSHNKLCTLCDYATTSETLMQEHDKSHHNVTDKDTHDKEKSISSDAAKEVEKEVLEYGSEEEDSDIEEACELTKETEKIETNLFKNSEFEVSNMMEKDLSELDENNGNVAFIINKYKSKKKPTFSRKVVNWKPAQTQRYKTTMYSCLGYFECDKCEKNSRMFKICSVCNIPFTHKICNAKKYVYFCENKCTREIYRACCDETPCESKLVILYSNKHTCITSLLNDNQKSLKFKQVETMEDIIENIAGCKENNKFDFENVVRVPSDIDGNKIYVLENSEERELIEIIRDGRKWQIFTQTTSQALANVLGEYKSKKMRKYKCSVQYFCFYEECPFKKRFEIVNQVNWNLEDGKRRCVSCSEEMESIECTASKFVAMSANKKFVLIKHIGDHKYLPKSTLETQILEEIEEFFVRNPTATRSEAIVHHLVSKINFGSKQDVIDLVSVSLNIWELNNCKQKGIKRLNPHGSKMEAIRHLKKKLEDIGNPFDIILKVFDDVFICQSCLFISEQTETKDCVKFCVACSMIPMEHVGPAVFISSRESLATLRELQVNGSLETEACCLDHQPSRLRAFTTFAAYVYDLDLRRMCPLFASVMTKETELAVYHCLDVVDRCMAEQFDKNTKFDPNMLIADEASAIKNAVERKLGSEKFQKQYGTCQLHYKGSALQHCSFAIGDKKSDLAIHEIERKFNECGNS